MSQADDFAIALDELLEQLELTPERVAKAMRTPGVDGALVQRWRDGLAFPCPRHLAQLIETLGVTRSRLLP